MIDIQTQREVDFLSRISEIHYLLAMKKEAEKLKQEAKNIGRMVKNLHKSAKKAKESFEKTIKIGKSK